MNPDTMTLRDLLGMPIRDVLCLATALIVDKPNGQTLPMSDATPATSAVDADVGDPWPPEGIAHAISVLLQPRTLNTTAAELQEIKINITQGLDEIVENGCLWSEVDRYNMALAELTVGASHRVREQELWHTVNMYSAMGESQMTKYPPASHTAIALLRWFRFCGWMIDENPLPIDVGHVLVVPGLVRLSLIARVAEHGPRAVLCEVIDVLAWEGEQELYEALFSLDLYQGVLIVVGLDRDEPEHDPGVGMVYLLKQEKGMPAAIQGTMILYNQTDEWGDAVQNYALVVRLAEVTSGYIRQHEAKG